MPTVEQIVAQLASIEDHDLLEGLKKALEERPSVVQELVDWAVPDKAYVSSRLLLENRLNGTIKSYAAESGYGFIDCPEVKEAFGNDVFLHSSQVGPYGTGQAVSFALLLNKERKPQAFDVGPPAGGKKGGKGKDDWGMGGKGGKSAAALWAAEAWGKGASLGVAQALGWGKGMGAAMDPWGGWGADPWSDPWAVDDWGWKGPAAKGMLKGCSKGKLGGGGKTGAVSAPAGMEMEGVTDRRFEGIVKNFNADRGFGFINCDEIQEMFGADVWLHHKQAEACVGFEVGAAVTFGIFLNKEGKPQGKDLTLVGNEDLLNADLGGGDELPVGKCKGGGKGLSPLCKFWGTSVGCRNGEACPFRHTGEEGVSGQFALRTAAAAGGPGKLLAIGAKSSPVSAPKTAITMAGVTDRRFVGIVKSYNAEWGFGFITCEEIQQLLGHDVWLHHKQAEACAGFEVGAAITFGVFLNKEGKPQGKDVKLAGMEDGPAAKKFKVG